MELKEKISNIQIEYLKDLKTKLQAGVDGLSSANVSDTEYKALVKIFEVLGSIKNSIWFLEKMKEEQKNDTKTKSN